MIKFEIQWMGWPTGFEPATARSTIWGSNQAELRPPTGRQGSFPAAARQGWLVPERGGSRPQSGPRLGASWHCHRRGSGLACSADWQSTGSLLFRRMVFGRWADCQSATQQTASLRYGGSAKMRPPRFGQRINAFKVVTFLLKSLAWSRSKPANSFASSIRRT